MELQPEQLTSLIPKLGLLFNEFTRDPSCVNNDYDAITARVNMLAPGPPLDRDFVSSLMGVYRGWQNALTGSESRASEDDAQSEALKPELSLDDQPRTTSEPFEALDERRWGAASYFEGGEHHCMFCTRASRALGVISAHQRTSCFPSESYSCDQCGASFARWSTLQNHLRVVHSITFSKDEAKSDRWKYVRCIHCEDDDCSFCSPTPCPTQFDTEVSANSHCRRHRHHVIAQLRAQRAQAAVQENAGQEQSHGIADQSLRGYEQPQTPFDMLVSAAQFVAFSENQAAWHRPTQTAQQSAPANIAPVPASFRYASEPPQEETTDTARARHSSIGP